MVNEYINLLTEDILTTMDYLYYNYRKVRSEKVTQKESEVIAIEYQHNFILLILPIENLQKLAKEVGTSYIDKQLLEKGLIL